MTREYTNRLLEAIAEGWISRTAVIEACLKYMSEDEVKDMIQINELLFEDIEDADEDQ